jgi:hypothetical protein
LSRLAKFRTEWQSIYDNERIGLDAKVSQARKLASKTVMELGDNSHDLLAEIGRSSAVALEYVGDALNFACATGFKDSPTTERLGFIPFVAMSPDQNRFVMSREIDLAAVFRTMLDGAVDTIAAFSLTIEEAIDPRTCRRVFEQLSLGNATWPDGLSAPSQSMLDGLDEDGAYRVVRLLPILTDSTQWELSRADRLTWQKRAFEALEASNPSGLWVYPQGPYRYEVALGVAESFGLFETSIRKLLAATGAATAIPHEPMLIEAFGGQSSGVANHFRLTLCGRTATFQLALPYEAAHWRFMAEKIANIALEQHGVSSEIAPLVQELELLINGGPKRICFIFGRSRAFEEPFPDGLPLNSHQDKAFRKYWEYERSFARDGELGEAIVKSLRIMPDARSYGCMVLDGRVWRPCVIIEATRADRVAAWPPDPIELEAASALIALMDAREFCRTLVFGR